MHTAIVVVLGLLVLVAMLFAGHVSGGPNGMARAALYFLPVWLIGTAFNLYMGVRTAGYSVAEELPVAAVVFAIPAAVALFAWWRLPH